MKLIELLLVVAIIAILASMMLPALSRTRNLKSKIVAIYDFHNQRLMRAMTDSESVKVDNLWYGGSKP